ncbi:MAG: hypothetical protein CMJ76_06105 [Planctomycetaceae bacterium]|nr:hypothetical protein [Planctomycetaceae bacterium]
MKKDNDSLRRIRGMVFIGMVLTILGCGENSETMQVHTGPSELGKSLLLNIEPSNAMDVSEVLQLGSNANSVVVVGRIGGSRNPWVDGLAAFTLTDLSLTSCIEIDEDHCETPWDFCCDPELSKNILLVQMMSAQGDLINEGARQLLGVSELDTVVVEGEIEQDASGNITLAAKTLYLKKAS